MVKFNAFKPFVYAGGPDKSALISPPYDVISPALQNKLYRRHSANVVRLVLGREYPSDSAVRNRYTRAADFFKKWVDSKSIAPAEPGVFILRQEFELFGRKYRRDGLIASLDWSRTDPASIIPHEKTHRQPRLDRSRLLKALPLNFSPVFLISEGLSGFIESFFKSAKKEAFYSVPGEQGALSRLPPAPAALLLSFLADKKFVIADGHHRLRVSRENFAKDPAASRLMVYICDFSDEGCVILSHDDRKTPLDKDKIREVLKTGKLMRQKSTFFWPKLPSGLLMHPVKDNKDAK